MKIVYVILHYNAFEVTCECIDHILKICDESSEIVVVDNCSQNNSGQVMQKKYYENRQIHILINKQNLGFAKGNNVGYEYAQKEMNADIIVDINNDVIIDDENFENKLKEIYKNHKDVAVVATRIVNLQGCNQNPYRVKRVGVLGKIRSLCSYSAYYLSIKTGFMYQKMYQHHHRLASGKAFECKEAYGIVPHGSCMIYMPEYVKLVKFAFVPITFFYGEEDILYDYMLAMGLQVYYTERLCVLHKESVSTQAVAMDTAQRELFLTKSRMSSIVKSIIFRFRIKNKKYLKKINNENVI